MLSEDEQHALITLVDEYLGKLKKMGFKSEMTPDVFNFVVILLASYPDFRDTMEELLISTDMGEWADLHAIITHNMEVYHDYHNISLHIDHMDHMESLHDWKHID
jgi:hypothetical protein